MERMKARPQKAGDISLLLIPTEEGSGVTAEEEFAKTSQAPDLEPDLPETSSPHRSTKRATLPPQASSPPSLTFPRSSQWQRSPTPHPCPSSWFTSMEPLQAPARPGRRELLAFEPGRPIHRDWCPHPGPSGFFVGTFNGRSLDRAARTP